MKNNSGFLGLVKKLWSSTKLFRSSLVGGCVRMALMLGISLCTAHTLVAAPTLVSVVPARNATGVAVNSTIVFTFDTPMTPNTMLGPIAYVSPKGAVEWSGNLAAQNFTYSWSLGDTVLTCTYSGSLPSDATITWELNPAQRVILPLEDENSERLGNYTGSFTTGSGGGGGGPVDYITYIMLKGLVYVQSDASTVVPDTNGPAVAMASVNAGTNNFVSGATIDWAPANNYSMMGFNGIFMYGTNCTNQAHMEQVAPPGAYTFNIQRPVAGLYSALVQLPSPSVYPPIPQVLNFVSAQSINPTNSFTLSMNGFTNVEVNDTYCLQIDNTNSQIIYKETDFCSRRIGDPTVTSLVISNNTLTAGQSYLVTVTFSKLYDRNTNTTEKIVGHGALARSTSFTIHTGGSGSSTNRARLGGLFFNGSKQPSFVINADANQVLAIEFSTNLVNWTSIKTSTCPVSGSIPFEDINGGTFQGSFYRVKHQ